MQSNSKNKSTLTPVIPNVLTPSISLNLFLASLAINLFGLALPLALMQVYDRIVVNQAVNTFLWLSLMVLFSIFLESILKVIRDRITARLGVQFEYQLENSILASDLNKGDRKNDSSASMTLLDRMNDASQLRSTKFADLMLLCLDIPFAILYMVILFFLYREVAYFELVIVGILIVAVLVLRPIYSYLQNEAYKNQNSIQKHLIGVVEKISFIKAIGIEEKVMRNFEGSLESQMKSQKRLINITGINEDFTQVVGQINALGIIAVGSIGVMNHSVTLGVLTACMTIGGRVVGPVINLNQFWMRRVLLAQSRQRILSEFQTISSNHLQFESGNEQDLTSIVSVECKDVSVRISENNSSNNVNIMCSKGQITGILHAGEMNASVICRVLCGLVPISSGQLLYDGVGLVSTRLIPGCAYLQQNEIVFKGTVLDNLARYQDELRQDVIDIVESFDLQKFFSELPKGLSTMVSRESNLILPRSHLQIIGLVRALVSKPKFIVFDSFDSSLDEQGHKEFLKIIERISSTSIVVVSSSSFKSIANASRLYRVSGSQVLLADKHELINDIKSGVTLWA